MNAERETSNINNTNAISTTWTSLRFMMFNCLIAGSNYIICRSNFVFNFGWVRFDCIIDKSKLAHITYHHIDGRCYRNHGIKLYVMISHHHIDDANETSKTNETSKNKKKN